MCGILNYEILHTVHQFLVIHFSFRPSLKLLVNNFSEFFSVFCALAFISICKQNFQNVHILNHKKTKRKDIQVKCNKVLYFLGSTFLPVIQQLKHNFIIFFPLQLQHFFFNFQIRFLKSYNPHVLSISICFANKIYLN